MNSPCDLLGDIPDGTRAPRGFWNALQRWRMGTEQFTRDEYEELLIECDLRGIDMNWRPSPTDSLAAATARDMQPSQETLHVIGLASIRRDP